MSALNLQRATASALKLQQPSLGRGPGFAHGGPRKLFWKLLLLGVLAGGSLEGFWFLLGYAPSVRDDPGLWGLVRRQASRSAHAAVLVGTSRIHAGLDPAVLSREIPGHDWLDLALDGTSPLPVMEDLAGDPSFKGVVICDVLPYYLFSPMGFDDSRSREFVRYYHNHNSAWGDAIESELRTAVQSRLRLARDDANLLQLVRQVWVSRSLPQADPSSMLANRLMRVDFTHVNVARLTDQWVQVRVSDKRRLAGLETDANLARIAGWVRAIEGRGGKVVFLRMVVSGKVREIEERLYPQAEYWGKFARSQSTLFIDFSDYPALAKFTCPEGSHLDYRQTPAFSSAFARLLKELRVF